MNRNRKTLKALAVVLMAALSVAMIATALAGTLPSGDIDKIVNVQTDKSQVESPITKAVNQVRESVVGVNNYRTVNTGMGGYNFYFGGGFGGGTPRTRQAVSTGSGVVISAYGHILTNYHVVEDADRVTVTYGTKEAEATVVASDEGMDVAVLLVPGIEMEPVQLGDSDQLQVGEWAIVVGNPLGQEFERTVSVGVVSAFDREVESNLTDRYGRRDTVTRAMVQVDAAINRGNSGGGLFNTLGQLQGIPTMKYVSRSPGFGFSFDAGASIDNIGMCIPINSAKPLIREALEKYDGDAVTPAAVVDHGEDGAATDTSKPRIGVAVDTLNPNSALMQSGKLPRGAVVMKVEPNSPADKAGVQPGDILVEADGVVVDSASSLVRELADKQAGDKVDIKYFRAEGLMDIIDGKKDPSELGGGTYETVTIELKVLDQSL